MLFDLDGTLTDNYPGIARSIAYALDALGVAAPGDADVLRRCVGPPLRESFAWLLDTRDAAVDRAGDRAVPRALRRRRLAGNVVYDGIAEALDRARAVDRADVRLHVEARVFARRIVTLFGFAAISRGVYGADLAGTLDDKVKLLAHLAARRRRSGCDHDRRPRTTSAARMNGARSIGVLWGYGSRRARGATRATCRRSRTRR